MLHPPIGGLEMLKRIDRVDEITDSDTMVVYDGVDMSEFTVPSKKEVRRAGEILKQEPLSSFEDFEKAFNTLSIWRSLHSYPINTFQSLIRKKIKDLNILDALVAQRLKRAPSIIKKLERFPKMQLDRMQDIGGVRVVVNHIEEVYSIHSSLSRARIKHQAVLPPDDYIKFPKSDGYRSLHQVFRYNSDTHPELNGLSIEVQIRTKLQHSWATAVETLGIIEKSSFKTGEGSENIKRFFKLSSAIFSIEENLPILDEYKEKGAVEIVEEFEELQNELRIFKKLAGLTFSAKQIESVGDNKNAYHVIVLDTDKMTVSLTPFSPKQLHMAEQFYKSMEIGTKNMKNIDVVLISAGNLKDIKKAYPNYFLDTQVFIKSLNRICNRISKYKKII